MTDAMRPPPATEQTRAHVAIISGLSGAGKTAASKLLEDVGYRVIDNLPAELLRDLAQLVASEPSQFERVALVLDARSGDARAGLSRRPCSALEARGITPQVFFLEARDDVLIRRFSETRHRHPLDTRRRWRCRVDRARARAAGGDPRRGGRDHRHVRAVRPPAARALCTARWTCPTTARAGAAS